MLPCFVAYENLCVGESFVFKNIYFTCFMRPVCRQVILGIFSFISASFSTKFIQTVCLAVHDFTVVSILLKVDVFVFEFCCREEEFSCAYGEDLDISNHAMLLLATYFMYLHIIKNNFLFNRSLFFAEYASLLFTFASGDYPQIY